MPSPVEASHAPCDPVGVEEEDSHVLMDSGCWGADKCPHYGDLTCGGGMADPGLPLPELPTPQWHEFIRRGEEKMEQQILMSTC